MVRIHALPIAVCGLADRYLDGESRAPDQKRSVLQGWMAHTNHTCVPSTGLRAVDLLAWDSDDGSTDIQLSETRAKAKAASEAAVITAGTKLEAAQHCSCEANSNLQRSRLAYEQALEAQDQANAAADLTPQQQIRLFESCPNLTQPGAQSGSRSF